MPVGLVPRLSEQFNCLSSTGLICLIPIANTWLELVHFIIHKTHVSQGQGKPCDVKAVLNWGRRNDVLTAMNLKPELGLKGWVCNSVVEYIQS